MAKKTKGAQPNDLHGIIVSQSNRVTNARYDYSLIQERLLTWIMYHLQVYIKEVMNGKQVHQLDLFHQQVDTFLIEIPLNRIGKPAQYRDIREACEQMTTVPVLMVNPERHSRRVAGLISSVETTYHAQERTNKLTIEMRRDIVALIIDVDKKDGRPAQYTQYMLHVALQARNKYTPKLYKLLCSWREKGGFRMTLEKLRDFLQIDPKAYKNFADLKRFVLEPAQKELRAIGDLWFNVADREFAVYEGKKVIGLNFKVIEPMSEEMLSKKIDHLFWTLKTTFGCTQQHCEKIRTLLTKDTNWQRLAEVLDRCYVYAQENPVKFLPAFVIKSITNELTPE